jgi:hypothetical protein
MKDHEIAAIVNQLRDVAKEYGQTQQLRDRIASLIVPVLEATPAEQGAIEKICTLIQPNPLGELGPTDEPESQYRFGYNTAIEDALIILESDGHPTASPVEEVLRAEISRLNAIINMPQSDEFLRAVSTEAEHQRQRWSSSHDAGKTPADWFWLVGYLAGKALHAHAEGNTEKAEHHIITTAAACANWHRAMFGKTDMRPGIDGETQQ